MRFSECDYISDKVITAFRAFSVRLRKQATRLKYEHEITNATRFLGRDFLDYDRESVELYGRYLLEACSLAPSTIQKKLAMLSSFGSFLEKEEIWPTNPFYVLTTGSTVSDYQKNILNRRAEVEAFLGTFETQVSFDIYLAVKTVYRTGCYIEELLEVQFSNCLYDDQTDTFVLVFHDRPPYRLTRRCTLPSDLTADYHILLSRSGDGCIFLNSLGKPLKYWTVTRAVHDLAPEGINLVSLRNMAQYEMLQAGATPEQVSDYVGTTGKWINRYVRAVHAVDAPPSQRRE